MIPAVRRGHHHVARKKYTKSRGEGRGTRGEKRKRKKADGLAFAFLFARPSPLVPRPCSQPGFTITRMTIAISSKAGTSLKMRSQRDECAHWLFASWFFSRTK